MIEKKKNNNLKKKNTKTSAQNNTKRKNNNIKSSNSKTRSSKNTGTKKSNAKNTMSKKSSTKNAANKNTNSTSRVKKIIKSGTYSNKVKSNTKTKRTTTRSTKAKNKPPVRIIFLGGLNEIGKNITLFECNNDLIILDSGMAFPDGDMLGVDLVIPDFTFIEQNKNRIKGIVITHGHEDHIGSLPYLLQKLDVPVYGTALTIGLIENKLSEHTFNHQIDLVVKKEGDHIKLGCFDIEMIHVNHSIPDAVGVCIKCPGGTIVHTGDFKVDYTPMSGGMTNLQRFSELGNEGVLALLADSTNADSEGYTPTEQTVLESLDGLFRRARKKRIIVATFASNISRVQQIINCADKFNRKVAYSGKSMVNIMKVAENLGYLKVPENIIVDLNEIKDYPSDKIVLITTGSQGEPMAALSRMAFSEHKKVEVGAGDFIIISANPIPGNETQVGAVVDELLKRGCEVIYESMYEVHVSGHARREELKLIQSLVKPKYFIPVHGEQKHLVKHMELSMSLGMDRKNIYIGDVGKVVELTDSYIKEVDTVQSGKVFVDGLGVGDVGSVVLKDRKRLSEDGLIVIVAALDVYDRHIITGPDVVSRGFVYVRENEELIDKIKSTALNVIEDCERKNIRDYTTIRTRIRDDVSKLVLKVTKRSPMILPILEEV